MPTDAPPPPRVFRVELTDAERAALDRRARAAGLSPDDALRALVRDGLRDGPSAHDLGKAAAGCADGPGDLTTNPSYFDDFGT